MAPCPARPFGPVPGLRLLLACLFLGVGALAATGTLTSTIERNLATKGRETGRRCAADPGNATCRRRNARRWRAMADFMGTRMQAMATGADAVAAP
jgi:putative ABC transport system permease protein